MSELCCIPSTEQRRQLLTFARQTTLRILGTSDPIAPIRPIIKGRFGGVFVTFWNAKKLRGCVGTFVLTNDIAAAVEDMTAASLGDSRFVSRPIELTEMPRIKIEISVLSEPELTIDPSSLIPGVHGVVVRRGTQSGCFLPKVATDRGWSAEEFLGHCCTMKAGLPRDAWRDSETEVQLFRADVLSELESHAPDTREREPPVEHADEWAPD